MTFNTKLLWFRYHCILGLIKYMDLLIFIMELDTTFHNVIILIKSVVVRVKVITTIVYFQKKVHTKINPIQNLFK